MRNNSAECFIENADGVFRAREIQRLEPQDRWDKEAIYNVIGVPWRMTGGKRTVDRPEVRVDPIPIPPLPFEGARIQRERITKKDIDEFGATIGCQGCNAIKDNKRAQAHSDRCRLRIEECLRKTPHGAERLDRRNELINEALADQVRRGKERKGTDSRCPEKCTHHIRDKTSTTTPATRSPHEFISSPSSYRCPLSRIVNSSSTPPYQPVHVPLRRRAFNKSRASCK